VTTPVFILSLPRSGSTLLQRMLAVNKDVRTLPEPWFLLPLAYVLRGGGVYAEYDQSLCVRAAEGFLGRLPGGADEFREAVRLFAYRLYSTAADESRYFVDKTPRYHLIAAELLDIFPDAKFIFLYRNPLAVLSSIIATWRLVHIFKVDLYTGLASLVSAAGQSDDRAHLVRYEDLVSEPESQVSKICEYLQLEYDPRMCSEFTEIEIPVGDFGNPPGLRASGTNQYSGIETKSLERWKTELSKNPLRKAQARRYLNWIGPDRLGAMGYSFDEIYQTLQSEPTRLQELGSDLVGLMRGWISIAFETPMMRDKLSELPNFERMVAHR
jgi:hypothetical protein